MSKFLPYGYTAFRRDHTDGWGGVLLIVKNKLICEQISISEGPELVAIKIQTYRHLLIVAACYHPPKYSKEQSKVLFEEIAGLVKKKNKKCPIWIGGDLPDINWEITSVISHQYLKNGNDKFREVIDDCYLEQLVTFLARASNTLDLLLTNRPSLLRRCKSTPSFKTITVSFLVICNSIYSF